MHIAVEIGELYSILSVVPPVHVDLVPVEEPPAVRVVAGLAGAGAGEALPVHLALHLAQGAGAGVRHTAALALTPELRGTTSLDIGDIANVSVTKM